MGVWGTSLLGYPSLIVHISHSQQHHVCCSATLPHRSLSPSYTHCYASPPLFLITYYLISKYKLSCTFQVCEKLLIPSTPCILSVMGVKLIMIDNIICYFQLIHSCLLCDLKLLILEMLSLFLLGNVSLYLLSLIFTFLELTVEEAWPH